MSKMNLRKTRVKTHKFNKKQLKINSTGIWFESRQKKYYAQL